MDFDEGSVLTCAHLEQVLTETFELGAPFILLEDLTCVATSTSSSSLGDVQICHEIETTFYAESQVVPQPMDLDALVCIALSSPEVDILIDALNLLSGNPFEGTTALTCDL